MAASVYLVSVRGLGGEEFLLSPGGGRPLLTSAQDLGLDGFCVLYPGTDCCGLLLGVSCGEEGENGGFTAPPLGTDEFCFICSPHTQQLTSAPLSSASGFCFPDLGLGSE